MSILIENQVFLPVFNFGFSCRMVIFFFTYRVEQICFLSFPAQLNALLPTDTFITVMRGLMANQLPSVRRKAMELLNNKLQHKTQWAEQQVPSREGE